MGPSRWLRYFICFALSAALVIVYFVVVSVNATTVALTILVQLAMRRSPGAASDVKAIQCGDWVGYRFTLPESCNTNS